MKIYKGIRKITAPPTKQFKDNKDKLKNKLILNEIEEYINEFELEEENNYKEIIEKTMNNHKEED